MSVRVRPWCLGITSYHSCQTDISIGTRRRAREVQQSAGNTRSDTTWEEKDGAGKTYSMPPTQRLNIQKRKDFIAVE